MLKKKKIEIILTFLLVTITLFVFSKNFYNERLVKNYATKPGNDKGRKKKAEHDAKKVGYYDWC